jgi:hypothetical protein
VRRVISAKQDVISDHMSVFVITRALFIIFTSFVDVVTKFPIPSIRSCRLRNLFLPLLFLDVSFGGPGFPYPIQPDYDLESRRKFGNATDMLDSQVILLELHYPPCYSTGS